jgi:hypothetical protein
MRFLPLACRIGRSITAYLEFFRAGWAAEQELSMEWTHSNPLPLESQPGWGRAGKSH